MPSSAESVAPAIQSRKPDREIVAEDWKPIKLARRSSTFLSEAKLSPLSTIGKDVLQFHQSMAYDCRRLFNLCLIEPDVLVFASGNYLHFFTISTRSITTRRSCLGGGIGYITKNPNPIYNFLTVAENGTEPLIIIYKYPEMDAISLCEGGTERAYSYVDYSTDGEMMASQGAHPDFMITLWQWKTGTVILRTRSFQNSVYKITFSHFNSGQLSTCGIGHIKFWKICETFTGLKLVGEHGRFGKTEICDIVSAFAMPLSSTLSGSEWGNILVWEEGLIKFEVCRKNRKRCHAGPISEIFLNNGEIMTVGKDGYVRIWFWETVDLADPPDDDLFVEIDPIYEYKIGSEHHQCSINSMTRMNEESFWWYVQDSNGGIWKADISPEIKPQPSQLLMQCHAGAVVALAMCPFGPYFATLDEGGNLHMYDYVMNKLLFFRKYPSPGQCIIWLPLSIDPSGIVLVIGFSSGVIRVVCVNLSDSPHVTDENRLILLQVWKPHSMAVTKMAINPRSTILVTAAMDSTLFIHQISIQSPFVHFYPIGFIDIPSAATALNWKPNMFSTLLVGCLHGQVIEVDLPERQRSYTERSYKLTHIESKSFQFESKKSEIRQNIRLAEIEKRKLAKRAKKQLSLERLRSDNPNLKIDEEVFLADSDEEEELDPIYIPPIPNKVLWLMYTADGTIWLSMGQFDSGYIYEFSFDSDHPMICTPILDADDLEINCYLYYENYLIFGMQDGAIRVNRVQANHQDLSDYWLLTMHDNQNGVINGLAVSYDHQQLVSVGADGNIFTYKWSEPGIVETVSPDVVTLPTEPVDDILNSDALSLEQQKQKHNVDQRNKVANARKADVRKIVASYKAEFERIMARNKQLIETQRIPQSEIVLDERIAANLKRSLKEKRDLVKRKLAFDLEKKRLLLKKVRAYFIEPLDHLSFQVFAIRSPLSLKTFRVHRTGDDFHAMVDFVKNMIQIELDAQRILDSNVSTDSSIDGEKVLDDFDDTGPPPEQRPRRLLKSFVEVLTSSSMESKCSLQTRRLLKKYSERKLAEEQSEEMWSEIKRRVPDIHQNDPKDDEAIRLAAATIGDYKLRTDTGYVSTDDESSSASKKFQQLLNIRQELVTMRTKYNRKVSRLRDKKRMLVKYVKEQREDVLRLHKEIPVALQRMPMDIENQQVVNLEYPECDLLMEQPADLEQELTMKKEFIMFTDGISPDLLDPSQLPEADVKTPFMIELLDTRRQELVFEQNQRIADIEHRVELFDEEVKSLDESRLEIEVAAKFLDVFLLTVYQELWVLRDFKQLDDDLVSQVNEQVMEKNKISMERAALRAAIDQNRKNIELANNEEKQIQNMFKTSASNNKFWDFLRKVFKKKFRPVRIVRSDESVSSVSEESSTDEEEDDNVSLDSFDIGPIHMDENICPAGCDRDIYDMTFSLRSKRHKIEENLREYISAIENSELALKQLKITQKAVEAKLKIRTDNLQNFRQVKQSSLNEIETLVILRMSQLQYVQNHEDLYDIPNTLLFNNECISSLYARVALIELETIEARKKHRKNVIHLSRMRADCNFMEKQIHDLEETYDEEMLKKFGMKVNLDELEEGILRKMVYNLRADVTDIQAEYKAKERELRKEKAEREDRLKCIVQQEIEKLNILTVLQEEKNFLTDLFTNQYRKEAPPLNNEEWQKDIARLEAVANQQRHEMQTIQNEIQLLALKAKDFVAVSRPEPCPASRTPFRSNFSESEYSYNTQATGESSTNNHKAVHRLVKAFFHKLSSNVDAWTLKLLIEQVSTFVISSAPTFQDPSKTDELKNVVENFQKLIPVNLGKEIAASEIALLFQNVAKLFSNDDVDHPLEMLRYILEDTFESLQNADMQAYIVQALKDCIMSMPFGQLVQPLVVMLLCTSLSDMLKKRNVDGAGIDAVAVRVEVVAFAEENYVEGVEVDQLEQIIEGILVEIRK